MQQAHQLFTALQLEFPDRTDYSFFEALAAFFNGDQEALERLTQFNPVAEAAYLRALQAFLQVYVAALNGPPEQAAEAARAWISNPDMVRQLGLGTQQINRFAALCILHGAGRRKQRVRNLFNRLCAQYEEGFWDLANALVRHRLAVMSGVEHAKWEDLEACDQAYQKLLDASRPEERPLIHQEYAGLLRFKVRLALQENDIENGLDLLGRLEELTTPIPPEVKALRNLLEKRMARPSHEKAYAVMDRNPDAARTVWLTLLERDPRDPIILQHLACLAWSHAYDAVLAEDYDASVPFWKEGLAWYQQVFLQPAYWEQLRLKGQTLGKMSGCEFDEQAFNTWRQDALYLTAHTMLDLIFHVMAGFDPANRSSKLEKPVGIARALMRVIRKFEAIDPEEKYTLRNRLSVDLAKHYLDPDPTNLTDLDTSLARAILVLDIDPDNVPARSFMLRATTHHVYISSKEGDRDFPKLFNRLDGLKTQAEWLEERLDTFESELRSRIRGDLASYYDQMGEIKHDEGQYVTSKINEAIRRGIITEILIRAEQMQACYQVSDAHFKKSLDLDPATARARERIQHHSRESQALSDLLRQVRGY